jgi:DNA invertase Pin-like site-specific DNA recombinase
MRGCKVPLEESFGQNHFAQPLRADSIHDQQTQPLQLKAMRQHARRRGWKVIEAVEDVGSGAGNRPQREELIKAARRRRSIGDYAS